MPDTARSRREIYPEIGFVYTLYHGIDFTICCVCLHALLYVPGCPRSREADLTVHRRRRRAAASAGAARVPRLAVAAAAATCIAMPAAGTSTAPKPATPASSSAAIAIPNGARAALSKPPSADIMPYVSTRIATVAAAGMVTSSPCARRLSAIARPGLASLRLGTAVAVRAAAAAGATSASAAHGEASSGTTAAASDGDDLVVDLEGGASSAAASATAAVVAVGAGRPLAANVETQRVSYAEIEGNRRRAAGTAAGVAGVGVGVASVGSRESGLHGESHGRRHRPCSAGAAQRLDRWRYRTVRWW